MSIEFECSTEPKLEATAIDAIMRDIAQINGIEVVRQGTCELGIQLDSLPPNSWGEHLAISFKDGDVYVASHVGAVPPCNDFIERVASIIRSHGSECMWSEM